MLSLFYLCFPVNNLECGFITYPPLCIETIEIITNPNIEINF